MKEISARSSKREMCQFLADRSRFEIKSVIDFINEQVEEYEYEFHIPSYGTRDELVGRMRSDRMLEKKIIFRAIKNELLCNKKDEKFSKVERELRVSSISKGLQPKIGKLVAPKDLADIIFDFSSLNLDGDLDCITRRVCNYYDLRHQKELRIHNHNLILSGPSGTGKSYFAKYLAKITGKSVLMTSPSSYLRQNVGEGEKAVQETFQYAEKNDYILFIDEIEGMIGSRGGADHSWEVTLVNEFLVRLEEFKGVCVVATNLYENIDNAFLRRFSDKLKFGFIKDNQRVMAVRNKFAQLMINPNDTSFDERIVRDLIVLTPGDLEAVYKRIILDNRKFSMEGLFEEIAKEVKAKAHVYKSSIGVCKY